MYDCITALLTMTTPVLQPWNFNNNSLFGLPSPPAINNASHAVNVDFLQQQIAKHLEFRYLSAEVDENIVAGNILYIKQNGHLALGSNIDNEKSQIVGVALGNGSPGFAVTYSSFGCIFLNDWTNIIGSVTLVPGTDYFLDNAPGKITSNRPFAGYLLGVGKANSTNSLVINLQIKIQL